jgi:hypothetical protein
MAAPISPVSTTPSALAAAAASGSGVARLLQQATVGAFGLGSFSLSEPPTLLKMLAMAALNGAVGRASTVTATTLAANINGVGSILSEIQQSQGNAEILQKKWSTNQATIQQIQTIVTGLANSAASARPGNATPFDKARTAAFQGSSLLATVQTLTMGRTASQISAAKVSPVLRALYMAILQGAIYRAGTQSLFNSSAGAINTLMRQVSSALAELQQAPAGALQALVTSGQTSVQQINSVVQAQHDLAVNAIRRIAP